MSCSSDQLNLNLPRNDFQPSTKFIESNPSTNNICPWLVFSPINTHPHPSSFLFFLIYSVFRFPPINSPVSDPRRFRVRIGTSSSSPPPSPAYSTVLSCSSSMKFEGVSEEMKKMVSSANLDQAPERRRIREAFKDVQLEIDHYLFKVSSYL